MAKLISIIIPMYDEEAAIDALFSRLSPVIADIKKRFGFNCEVIVNDNHSTDATYAKLSELAQNHDPRSFHLRIFRFSKNIGVQKSILVGLNKSQGDAVLQIDADLQDPPELFLDFIEKWLEGHEVVYGVRRKRPNESFVLSTSRKLFYRLINKISTDELPHDSGDFRLIDRKLVNILCAMHDYDPYIRGLVASLGFSQIGVLYDRDARTTGHSKFRLGDLAKLSIDGITNHSAAPLRLSSYFAFFVVLLMIGFGGFYLYSWAFSGQILPFGLMTQIMLQLGGIAALALMFAIQGAYINRIFNQVKDKPLAIIESRIELRQGKKAIKKERAEAIEVLWFGAAEDGKVAEEKRASDDI